MQDILEVVKDYFRMFGREFIISVLLIALFMYYGSILGCQYKLTNNITVYGTCNDLGKYQKNLANIPHIREEGFEKLDMFNDSVNNEKIKYVYFCNTTTTTSTTLITSTTLDCIIEHCECDPCIRKDVNVQSVKNARPPLDNSAYSDGFFEMKKVCLTAIGEKTSKFREGSPVEGYELFYKTLHGNKSTEENNYCFIDLGGYFYLNRTPDENNRPRWGWNDSLCLGSWLKVEKL